MIDEGASYVQLDAPSYSTFFDPKRRASLRASGIDSAEALDAAIAADNGMIQDIKRHPESTIGIHFCRGNKRSAWGAEGSYEPIAEKAFGSLQMDRFLMEFDTERAGGFEPLRFVPKGKTVVLGLITTKEPTTGIGRRIAAAHRASLQVCADGKSRPQHSMRLRFCCFGESPFLGGHATQARTGHQGRAQGLGMTEFVQTFNCSSRSNEFQTVQAVQFLDLEVRCNVILRQRPKDLVFASH